MFICGYCGKEYETPQERNACEEACCSNKAKREKELNEKERYEKEAEIHNKLTKYDDLRNEILGDIDAYNKKYDTPIPYFSDFKPNIFDWLDDLFTF